MRRLALARYVCPGVYSGLKKQFKRKRERGGGIMSQNTQKDKNLQGVRALKLTASLLGNGL